MAYDCLGVVVHCMYHFWTKMNILQSLRFVSLEKITKCDVHMWRRTMHNIFVVLGWTHKWSTIVCQRNLSAHYFLPM